MKKLIFFCICIVSPLAGIYADIETGDSVVVATSRAILSKDRSIVVLYRPATGIEAIRLFKDISLEEGDQVAELAKSEGLFAGKYKNMASIPHLPEFLYYFIDGSLGKGPNLNPRRGKGWFGVAKVNRILEDFEAYRIVVDNPQDTFLLLNSKDEIQHIVDNVMPGLKRIHSAVKEGELSELGENDFTNPFVRKVFLEVIARQLVGEEAGSE